MKKVLAIFFAVLLAFGLVACNQEETGSVLGGTIKCDGVGLEGVTILIDGDSKATTNESGVYSLGDFTETVTLTPVKEGYEFMPASLTVTFARDDADFTATKLSTEAEPIEAADKTRIPAPTDGSLYDDFSSGIAADGKWNIVNKKWGAAEFNGTTASNVNYTADGILVLSSKGNYYPNASERNTGAAIVTKEALGPGKFEVAAKISPRLGMCSAIWTFYYESESVNHEIDIEFPGQLNGRIGYDTVMNTNWQGTSSYTSHTSSLADLGLSAQNDGKWHKYGFEWSVKNQTIKYYIDDVLTYEATTYIPSYESQLWIAVWEPVSWAGVPNYETSDMLVDWVAYTSYNETQADGVQKAKTEYLESKVAGENSYPKAPIVLDEYAVDIVSNSDFSGVSAAWSLSDDSDMRSGIIPTDYTSSNKVYRLIGNSSATQTVTAVYEGFEYNVEGLALVSGENANAEFAVEFLDENGDLIGNAETFSMKASDDYEAFSGTVVAPEGSVAMRFVLRSSGANTVALFDWVGAHRVFAS